jgi:dihydroorotate dehydrogenase (NAD+) catalytic subunit
MIVGASAIQIGTLNFIDPAAPGKMVGELEEYCKQAGINKLSDLIKSFIIDD